MVDLWSMNHLDFTPKKSPTWKVEGENKWHLGDNKLVHIREKYLPTICPFQSQGSTRTLVSHRQVKQLNQTFCSCV